MLPSPEVPSDEGGLLGGVGSDGTAAPVLLALAPQEALRVAEASASSVLVAVVVP